MIPILFPEGTTSFTTNGLGRLTDCISCKVTEERNGVYEVEFVYPVEGIHYSDIQEGCIIYTTHDNDKSPEPFDIYGRSAPIDGNVTFFAHHVSYRLTNVVVKPFTVSGNAQTALRAMKTNAVNTCDFDFYSDKTATLNFGVSSPVGLRSMLSGVTGSILDVYGSGEYEFNGFDVWLYNSRGVDHGVSIRYGKNLTNITARQSIEGTYTGVVPYWQNEGTLVTLPEWYILAPGATQTVLVPLDLTNDFSEMPTVNDLRTRAQTLLNNSEAWLAEENIEVNFAALWQTTEYEGVEALQEINLCDQVSVIYPALGVNIKKKVIKTVYDPLGEKYTEITLGTSSATLAQTITNKTLAEVQKTTVTKGFLSAAIDDATQLITGGLGGYVVIGTNADGQPEEILIMDTDDVQTATNVIRMNKNGIGFSSTGYQGPFTSAWTIDGTFNTNYIVVNNLSVLSQNAGEITAGVLRSPDYSYTEGNTYATAGMIVDLNNKTIRATKFVMDATGQLVASDVHLQGALVTRSGNYTTSVNAGRIRFYNTLDGVDYETLAITPIAWGNDYVNSRGSVINCQAKYLALAWGGVAGYIVNNGLNPDGFTDPNLFDGNVTLMAGNLTLARGNLYIADNDTSGGTSKGLYFKDSTGTYYRGMGDNGSNLWIGAVNSSARQHVGGTYISSGYNGTAGNESIFVCVPNAANTGGTAYKVLHVGNFSTYALPLSGGTLSGGLTFSAGAITMRNGETIDGIRYESGKLLISLSCGIKTNGHADVSGKTNIFGGDTYVDGDLTGTNLITASKLSTDGRTAANDGKPGFYANAAGNVFIVGDTSSGAHLYFYFNKATTNTASIYEAESGVIAIGAPNGFRVANVYNTTDSSAANVTVQSNGRLVRSTASSKRYKHDIKPLLDYKDVLKIPVVSYIYNEDYLSKADQRYNKEVPGFIAEDVAEVYPVAAEIVDGRVEDWNVRFIVPPMLAVQQEHEKRIAELERENAELKQELADIKALLKGMMK